MATLLQLILPAFIAWLIWRAFRSPKHSGNSSPGSGSDDHGDGSGGD